MHRAPGPKLQDLAWNKIESPYIHFVIPELFDSRTATDLQVWAEASEDWMLGESAFYSQYRKLIYAGEKWMEAGLNLSIDLPERAIRIGELLFKCKLSRNKFQAHAHRFTPGQGIGIHNDWRLGETPIHRIVVFLNPEFSDRDGGHMKIYGSKNAGDLRAVYRPVHNMAVAFTVSKDSWHSVAKVKAGRRHSIVLSFY